MERREEGSLSMEIILIGNRREVWGWIRRQERMSGKRIDFVGVRADGERCTYIVQEGTKEDCPRLRTVRRYIERSEEISE